MKDIFTKLNEALAKLKEASASKYDEVTTKIATLTTTEAKLNCVEEALSGIVKESYDGDDLASVYHRKHAQVEATNPAFAARIKEVGGTYGKLVQWCESALAGTLSLEQFNKDNRIIKMNNGASHNGHGAFTESDRQVTLREASDKLLCEALGIPVAKKPEGLSETQMADFEFACRIGLSEADAMILAKLPLTEVNRRV